MMAVALVNSIITCCLFIVAIIWPEHTAAAGSLQCKGEHNEDVDWFVLYKIPKIQESKNSFVRNGVAYLYMTSNSNSNWILSMKAVSSKDSIPGYTLAPFYNSGAKDLLWFVYNDQPPNKPPIMINGHTKGVIIANSDEGFWLIHSVPNFPPQPRSGEDPKQEKRTNKTIVETLFTEGKYDYPHSGKPNGQSFLCISVKDSAFDTIGTQLMYNQLTVYKRNLPKNLEGKYRSLTSAANEIRVKKTPFNRKTNIKSSKGVEFTSFAKSGKWKKDLYDDFVAPELNSDLYVESWLNGRGRLPSDCNGSRVMNVQKVTLSQAHVQFKSSHDHSKWVVADTQNRGSWVCVGDINRAETQFNRGGGTVCLNVHQVWKNYRDAVNDIEPCPKPKTLFQKVKSWFGFLTQQIPYIKEIYKP